MRSNVLLLTKLPGLLASPRMVKKLLPGLVSCHRPWLVIVPAVELVEVSSRAPGWMTVPWLVRLPVTSFMSVLPVPRMVRVPVDVTSRFPETVPFCHEPVPEIDSFPGPAISAPLSSKPLCTSTTAPVARLKTA